MSNSVGLYTSIPGIIEDINISQIKSSSQPLRTSESSLSGLINSIQARGLLQPIIVRPKADYFEIVAGNRRCKACTTLRWRKITCHIVDLDDQAAFECSIIENIQRKTLSIIEEAEAFKTYVADFGWGGISELAKKIGKSPSYITKRIKLLNMPVDVIASIKDMSLDPSAAEELISVRDPFKQSELAVLITKRHLSLRKTRELISHRREVEKSRYSSDLDGKKRAFDKLIIILRVALNNAGQLINENEDDWIVREMLMQHKNMLHGQIDLLIKEKYKLTYRLATA